jgi:hypothetical protein
MIKLRAPSVRDWPKALLVWRIIVDLVRNELTEKFCIAKKPKEEKPPGF